MSRGRENQEWVGDAGNREEKGDRRWMREAAGQYYPYVERPIGPKEPVLLAKPNRTYFIG